MGKGKGFSEEEMEKFHRRKEKRKIGKRVYATSLN